MSKIRNEVNIYIADNASLLLQILRLMILFYFFQKGLQKNHDLVKEKFLLVIQCQCFPFEINGTHWNDHKRVYEQTMKCCVLDVQVLPLSKSQ